jgi:hypothetical protein
LYTTIKKENMHDETIINLDCIKNTIKINRAEMKKKILEIDFLFTLYFLKRIKKNNCKTNKILACPLTF